MNNLNEIKEQLMQGLNNAEQQLSNLSIDNIGADVFGSEQWTQAVVNLKMAISNFKKQIYELSKLEHADIRNISSEYPSSIPTDTPAPNLKPKPNDIEHIKTVKCDFDENGVCRECGYRRPVVASVPKPTVETIKAEKHDFDENGVCRQCGYKLGIEEPYFEPIPKTYIEEYDIPNIPTPMPTSKPKPKPNDIEHIKIEEHDFDENGICRECGYRKSIVASVPEPTSRPINGEFKPNSSLHQHQVVDGRCAICGALIDVPNMPSTEPEITSGRHL